MDAGFPPEDTDVAPAVRDAGLHWVDPSRPAVGDPPALDAVRCEPI